MATRQYKVAVTLNAEVTAENGRAIQFAAKKHICDTLDYVVQKMRTTLIDANDEMRGTLVIRQHNGDGSEAVLATVNIVEVPQA